ncbi:MAG: large subunit ribosomal protein L21 [Rhodothermales bacterium]|jgi:large subunit ribosomal protein L21
MYAIVEISGKQYKVRENDRLYVPRLIDAPESKVSFDQVLLVSSEDSVSVGTPLVGGASVEATVLAHVKADKVLVFKKKRRKGYKVKNGHRQPYTQLMIDSVTLDGSGPKAAAPKAEAAAPEAEAPKAKKAAKGDKLTKIEGIGPKIAELLAEAGFDTFAKVAAAEIPQLQEVLTAAGPRYNSHTPDTWPQQAALAAAGDWDTLQKLQDDLDGGRPA